MISSKRLEVKQGLLHWLLSCRKPSGCGSSSVWPWVLEIPKGNLSLGSWPASGVDSSAMAHWSKCLLLRCERQCYGIKWARLVHCTNLEHCWVNKHGVFGAGVPLISKHLTFCISKLIIIFFLVGSLYLALAVLELIMWTGLALNSQRSACFCLPSAVISCM